MNAVRQHAKDLHYDRRTAKIARYIPIVADGLHFVPISFQVALTDACFNRCIGCEHPLREQKTMDVSDWLDFLQRLPRLPESVCYSGGDPMAFREFNKVMEWHVANNVAFGTTITGFIPPFIDLALLRHAEWVRVSLDAVTPEVYEKVRGRTPVFKVLDGIDAMLAAGVHVALGITIHPDNEAEYPNVLRYAEAKGISDIDARYAYPNSNPRWPNVSLADRGVQKFEHCHASLFQLYIDSDGSVYPCCVTAGDTRSSSQGAALGNIYAEQWAAVWERVVAYSRRDISDLPNVCSTCCVQRLSEINHVCDAAPNGQSFF